VSGRSSKSDSSLTSFSKTTGTLVIVTTTGIISKVEYNSLSVAKKASKATDQSLFGNKSMFSFNSQSNTFTNFVLGFHCQCQALKGNNIRNLEQGDGNTTFKL
jgi:hypothetical protein